MSISSEISSAVMTTIYSSVGNLAFEKSNNGNHWACCPFHKEKSASFKINEQSGRYHCFGCGADGDVVDYIQKLLGLEIPDVVRMLETQYGCSFTKLLPADKGQASRQMVYKVNEIAANFYNASLLHLIEKQKDHPAVAYVKQRKLTVETIQKHRIGWGGDTFSSLLEHVKKNGIDDEDVLKSIGLFYPANEKYGMSDMLHHRLIFPIEDRIRVVGLAGRLIREKEGAKKYLNSSESAGFKKCEQLYNLQFAAEAIKQDNVCLIVEGYMDALSLSQAGIQNVVATMGTALSTEHIRLIRYLTNRVILYPDSDMAGQQAAARSLQLLMKEHLQVQMFRFKEVKDADELACQYSGGEITELIRQNRTDPNTFLYGYLHQAHPLKPQASQAEVSRFCDICVAEFSRVYRDAASPFRKQEAIEFLAKHLRIDPALLVEHFCGKENHYHKLLQGAAA